MSKLILEVEDSEKALLDAANIILRLRRSTRIYELNLGYVARNEKAAAEKKADKWLAKVVKMELEDAEGDKICSYFGCAKKLSLIEKLAGDKCTNHMGVDKQQFLNGKI